MNKETYYGYIKQFADMKKIILAIALLIMSLALPVSAAEPAGSALTDEAQSKRRDETPVILSQITAKTTKIKVYGYKNTKLYVKNGEKRIGQKTFKKDGIQTVRIKKQEKGTKLSFQLVNQKSGKTRTIYQKVGKKNRNLNARKQSASCWTDYLTETGFPKDTVYLTVKGTVGSTVYMKPVEKGKAGKWRKVGVVLDREGLRVKVGIKPFAGGKKSYCLVRLKGINGKYGKTMKAYVKPNKYVWPVGEAA